MRELRRVVVAAIALAVASCGYHLAGHPTTVPTTARTISIRRFSNPTRAYGLEHTLQRKVEEEFRRRGTLRVVDENGDVVLSGAVRRVATVPVAFNTTDEAVQYQSLIQVSIKLTERGGRVLYQNAALQEVQDFGAVSGVVIASSPHFQRGTVNARDLATLTNVQLGESRRDDALDEVLEQLAQSIYVNAMEGF